MIRAAAVSCRRLTARVLCAVVFGMMVVSLGVTPPVEGAPVITDPGCAGVQLAPEVATDRNPDGTPVRLSLDSRGKYVPVIMVHGWTGRATHGVSPTGAFSSTIDLSTDPDNSFTVTRSLIGQIQSLGGTAVFTFDYHNYSARWVTDPHLGPALGAAIDCLYEKTGEKVIIVGHSMGGLVARYALTQPAPDGSDRTQKVSTVVTLGTPQNGSLMALLVAGGLDLGALANSQLALVRVILAGCGALSSSSLQTGTPCDWLPDAVQAFDSEAGRALRAGSAQLRALAPWPGNVPLDAVGGDATFAVPDRTGWFNAPWKTLKVPMGDMIVDQASAATGSKLSKFGSCDYQLSVTRSATDSVGLIFGVVAPSEVARHPLGAFAGACFHPNLMRTVQLTNEVMGAIADDLVLRQPVTAAALLNAPVPSLCEHPAGTLVDGVLPGIPERDGGVFLVLEEDGSFYPGQVDFGDLRGQGELDAAVAVFCYQGGVGWPEAVVLYGPGPTYLGHVWLADITAGRQTVESLSISDGVVHVRFVNSYAPGQDGCCGSIDGTLDLRVVDGSVQTENVRLFDEREPAESLIEAGIAGDRAALDSIANPEAATAMLDLVSYGADLELGECTGASAGWPAEIECQIMNSDGYLVAEMGITKTGFGTWQVVTLSRFE